jgi:lipopolysaccharide export system protein LptA
MAAALYFSTRSRPAPSLPPLGTATDPAASTQSGEGTEVRYRGEDLQFRLDYDAVKQYPDGRVHYDHFNARVHGGTIMSAAQVDCRGQSPDGMPADCTLTGQVHFQSDDGTSFESESASYSQASGLATVPGAVSFKRGRMSGTGTGGNYERDSGIFRLFADVHVTIAPDTAGAGQAGVTSKTMVFARVGRSVVFDGEARIVRTAETMAADRATLFLSDDEQTFTAIQLRGGSRVAPVAGQTSDWPDMRADDIDLGFYPGTQALQRAALMRNAVLVQAGAQGVRSIEAPQITIGTAADGRTLTRLEALDRVIVRTPAGDGVPARTIAAPTLLATGTDQAGLTSALFDGGVEFTEIVTPARGQTAASTRTGTARTLRLALKGQLDAIEEATFQRDVRFRDGGLTGDADLGVYREREGRLELRPGTPARRAPHVADENGTVDASGAIVIALDTHDLDARGDVKTVTKGEAAGGARQSPSGMFDPGQTTYGGGDTFTYDSATDQAHYTGTVEAPAQLKQGEDTSVTAREIVINRKNQDLTAHGGVVSTFTMAGQGRKADDRAVPQRYRATADSLEYRDANRAAVYAGHPALLVGRDGQTTAQTITLTLQRTERRLERLDAAGAVHATQPGGREAYGDALTYDATSDQHTLTGHIALLTRDENGTCSITTGSVVHVSGDLAAPEFRAAENPAGSYTQTRQPCVRPAERKP